MKKLISTLTALGMGCVFAVSAMAAEPAPAFSMSVDMSHVYIEDATLDVGETYTWWYDGEAGPVDYGEEGTALRIVSGQNNDQGGMTFVYEAVEPGVQTFRIVNRWWTESYKTVTVTVEAGMAAEPETPAEEPETPAEEPETPAEEPETPTLEPETPAEEPETPVAQPEDPAEGNKVPEVGTNPSSEVGRTPAQTPAASVPQADDHGEIAQAKADGSWGAEYTTCPACGYHNWTAGSLGYVCDTCGHIVASVKGAAGVKGYTAPAVTARPAAQASDAQTVAESQAANDAYLSAIRALQDQVARREAAYLASIGG